MDARLGSTLKIRPLRVAGGKLGNALDQYLGSNPHVVKLITQLLHVGIGVVHNGSEHKACSNSGRKCELERITMTASKVVTNVIGIENADAVDDQNGLSAALKPSPFRA